ncbi:MAG: PKD domain-containing protein [Bacteroidota bacterium]|nr:PKD domain-containing protein [Bacteroidota bacterium]
MKTRLLIIGIFFLVSVRVSAQGGSTLVSGQNPYLQSSSSLQSIADPLPTPQDGNGTLGPIYQSTTCGLNYVTVSQKLGQRFSPVGSPQPANFNVSIPPACNPSIQPVILKAFVFAGGSGNGVAVSVSITNPSSVTATFPMTIIGQDIDKCWGYSGTYSYRADVTSAITGNGNYVMSGFPTNPPTSGNDLDGATLMIIYADPQATYEATITIWDGCAVGIGNNITQTINNFNACMNGTNSRAFAIIGDLQNVGTQFQFNNGPVFSYPAEDWWNFIDQPTTITVGQTTAPFSVLSTGDCYNFQMMGVYFQTTCTSCIPVTNDTIGMSSSPSTCTGNTGTATATLSTGIGPFTYLWNTAPPQNTQTATNLPPGVYTVIINDSLGCPHVDSVTVLGTGSLSATTASTNNICFGDTAGTATFTPTNGSPPYTYVWMPNVSTSNTAVNLGAGNYTVDVTDLFGCTYSHTFTITEPPNVPIVAAVSGATPICTGEFAQLIATATGGAPPYSYSWISPVSQNDSIVVSPATTTTYSVVVSDACNTTPDTATFTVNVNALPVITFSGDTLSGCIPLCVDFTASSNPALVSCTWNFGDNTTATGATPPQHCYLNSGQYNVTVHVTDVNGCKDSLTVNNYITVFPTPVAAFNIISNNPTTVEESNVVIDDLSIGGDTCYWDFGDGNQLVVPGCGDVSNLYEDIGTYQITQIVVNNGGCSDTIVYDVYIIPNTIIYIPNTFTPNGNGSNDFFFAYGEYINDFHMMVFDRWGNLIFESRDQAVGWDGRANGGKNIAQEDTYVYVVTYTEEFSARKHKIIGHVNLIR